MKRIVCEMCGSSDLIKQDGIYVCQYCGCKYTVEEAKKLMVEGTVDVSGSTVKVDDSEELKNLYQLARRAKNDNNAKNAEKYYDQILIKDPTNWEAAFYEVYFQAVACSDAQLKFAIRSVANNVDTTLKLIRDHVEDPSDQEDHVMEMAGRCTTIADIFWERAAKYYPGSTQTPQNASTRNLLDCWRSCINIFYYLGNNVDALFLDYEKLIPVTVAAWKNGLTRQEKLKPYLKTYDERQNQKAVIDEYEAKIRKYEPEYKKSFWQNFINS